MIKNMETSSFLNLDKVVEIYGHQPELLELILSSKVEEDRRRAEEARLRRKEIDYMLRLKKSTLLPSISTLNQKNSIGMLLSPPSFDLKLPEIQRKRSYINEEIEYELPSGSAPPSPCPSEPEKKFLLPKRQRRELQAPYQQKNNRATTYLK